MAEAPLAARLSASLLPGHALNGEVLRKSRELVHYLDLAAEEMARFDDEMGMLNLLPVYREPRATSAISEILSLIGEALSLDNAYEAGGAVYFDVGSDLPQEDPRQHGVNSTCHLHGDGHRAT